MKASIIITLLLLFNKSNANIYYVDPSSISVIADGTLANPWKTIEDVNNGTTLLNPGDMVLFRRGETFSGKLNILRSGTFDNPIVYGNYGLGKLPEFDTPFSDIINIKNSEYVVIDGIKITDKSIDKKDHSMLANISYAINIDNSPNCTVKNCDISLVGIGISVNKGSDYTTITRNYMYNLRMVRNTPTSINADDDFGANPMVIGSSNNIITYNRFEDCWALSYDYGYDGGAIEFFGDYMNNNKILYNSAINCNGFIEIGSNNKGVANDNIIGYNKIINCGYLGVYHNGPTFTVSINNLQYFNNNVIETIQHFTQPTVLFWMEDIGTQGMIVLKNNIFWLSSGIDFATKKFDLGQLIHSNNIYRMSSGSLGITLGSNEILNDSINLFSNTSGSPSEWDYALVRGCIAIDNGIDVGFNQDFTGNTINGNPDIGMLEYTVSIFVKSSKFIFTFLKSVQTLFGIPILL
jgi:hypothetical protein